MHELFASWCGLPASALPLIEHWEPRPYLRNGKVAAIGILDGTEIHFAVRHGERNALLQRDRIGEYLAPLIEERGFLTTRVYEGSDARFVERLGFEQTAQRGKIKHYMLCEVPFARR